MNNKRNTNNNREEKKSEERGVRNGGAQKPSVAASDRLRNGEQNEWVRGSYAHLSAACTVLTQMSTSLKRH